MENTEASNVEDIIKHLAGVRPKPLEWIDRSKDGYRLFQANSEVGRFCYGTDATNQPYFQTPNQEEDTATEEAAKLAAEEQYRITVFRKIAPFLVLAPETAGPSPAVIAELQAILAKYADACVEARYWGGPTIYPQNPITEDVARRFGELLTVKA
ncbi:hypothetical protein [Rhizobium sp. MHM7A]|uniref:hypothetical protein n=1 Tax=Rhizobium sp. MHM7A TaxID=2583233 RepID=UPI001106C931|nr:hypothetical protein [Rhizobium sp. MHM7A]TLX16266.1 hypothetical protein FFR93_02760 [Rhizobium sp. MHM7A]